MRFTWGELKRLANLAKHGLDFADVEGGFDFDQATTTPVRNGRFKAVGALGDSAS